METKSNDKKIGVFVYEMLGTSVIMYAFMVGGTFDASAKLVTFFMMLIAWNVSGGHFNPAISLGVYVSEKKWGGNILPLLLMMAGQFAGAFLGILWGYLALIDVDLQDKLASAEDVDRHSKVNFSLISIVAPLNGDYSSNSVYDLGTGDHGFTRDWQTFWNMLISSIILVVSFIAIKHPKT